MALLSALCCKHCNLCWELRVQCFLSGPRLIQRFSVALSPQHRLPEEQPRPQTDRRGAAGLHFSESAARLSSPPLSRPVITFPPTLANTLSLSVPVSLSVCLSFFLFFFPIFSLSVFLSFCFSVQRSVLFLSALISVCFSAYSYFPSVSCSALPVS